MLGAADLGTEERVVVEGITCSVLLGSFCELVEEPLVYALVDVNPTAGTTVLPAGKSTSQL